MVRTRRDRRLTPVRGFTLIEVLIALAVLAVGLVALVQAGGQRADNVRHLENRTLATWIADDRLTAMRLAGEWPSAGTDEGEREMAGRTWYWEAEVEETPEERVRRINVAVRLDEAGEPVARLTGFIGHPEDRADRVEAGTEP